MAASLAPSFPNSSMTQEECRDILPPPVARLLTAGSGPDADEAWAAFLAAYSPLLLRIAAAFAPGYDSALDRYAYMLDELRRNDCRRLRAYAAEVAGDSLPGSPSWHAGSAWITSATNSGGPGVRNGSAAGRLPHARCGVDSWSSSSPVEDLALLPDLTLRDPGEVVDEHDRRAAPLLRVERAEAKRPAAAPTSVRGGSHGKGDRAPAWHGVPVPCVPTDRGRLRDGAHRADATRGAFRRRGSGWYTRR